MNNKEFVKKLSNRTFGAFTEYTIYKDMICFTWRIRTDNVEQIKGHYNHYIIDIIRYCNKNNWKVLRKKSKIQLQKFGQPTLDTKIILIKGGNNYENN